MNKQDENELRTVKENLYQLFTVRNIGDDAMAREVRAVIRASINAIRLAQKLLELNNK